MCDIIAILHPFGCGARFPQGRETEERMSTHYDAGDITVLEGLEAVRLRPGMYIGTTSTKGLHHILWEIVDNAIDEAANGFADRIDVVLHKDGSASVRDNGRGIPTDIHPKTKVSGVQVVFTQLHAGGKFDEHNYSFSGGLHGVGASVTNALSKWLKVEVCRDGYVWRMEFHSYYDQKKKKWESGIPVAPLEKTKERTKKHGSFVHFLPDENVFPDPNFQLSVVQNRLSELAFLNKGITITLTDERVTMAEMKEGDEPEQIDLADATQPYHVEYRYDGGISDFREVAQRGEIDALQQAALLQDGGGRRVGGVRHPAYGGVHGKPLFLRQQHPHARGRHARDGLSGAGSRGCSTTMRAKTSS